MGASSWQRHVGAASSRERLLFFLPQQQELAPMGRSCDDDDLCRQSAKNPFQRGTKQQPAVPFERWMWMKHLSNTPMHARIP